MLNGPVADINRHDRRGTSLRWRINRDSRNAGHGMKSGNFRTPESVDLYILSVDFSFPHAEIIDRLTIISQRCRFPLKSQRRLDNRFYRASRVSIFRRAAPRSSRYTIPLYNICRAICGYTYARTGCTQRGVTWLMCCILEITRELLSERMCRDKIFIGPLRARSYRACRD